MYVSRKDVAARRCELPDGERSAQWPVWSCVADEARAINDVARELGYVPNALAHGPVQQASLTVGVRVDDMADPALWPFVMAAQQAAGAEGHVALIVGAQPGGDPALAVRKLREHRVGGIIVLAPSLEEDPASGRRAPRRW